MDMILVTFCMCYVFKTISGANFRLGLLLPFKHPRLGWTNNAAATTIAIEKAQAEGLLSGNNVR